MWTIPIVESRRMEQKHYNYYRNGTGPLNLVGSHMSLHYPALPHIILYNVLPQKVPHAAPPYILQHTNRTPCNSYTVLPMSYSTLPHVFPCYPALLTMVRCKNGECNSKLPHVPAILSYPKRHVHNTSMFTSMIILDQRFC